MAGDKDVLQHSLENLLGWDPVVASGVAEAVAGAKSQEEVDGIVRDYMGGGAEAAALVSRFRGTGKASPKSVKASSSSHNRPARAPGGGLVSSQAHTSSSQQQQAQQQPSSHKKGERPRGSLTVTHVAGRGVSKNAPSELGTSLPQRDVANCLCCGKIYFTHQDTADIVRFLEQGGICTFCGARVALEVGGSSETRPPASQRTQGLHASSSGRDTAGELSLQQANDGDNKAEAEARAFKDRLVDYDRNAQQRTRVVDDQNDFFEIDTNTWLEPQERELLKQQEQALKVAEEAQKRRVTFTVDLLGRQVLLQEDPGPEDFATSQVKKQALLAAAKATGAEVPQGGGTATAAALLATSRIQPSPSLRSERPMFVPTTPETRAERSKRRGLESEPQREWEEPQGVVGGWGDEQKAESSAYGSGMTAEDAARRRDRSAGSSAAAAQMGSRQKGEEVGNPSARSGSRSRVSQAGQGGDAGRGKAGVRSAKRPQLRRLQHDDPFEAADLGALDDVRPEVNVVAG